MKFLFEYDINKSNSNRLKHESIDFDKKFDDGDDNSGILDLSSIKKVNHHQKRINIDIPVWMIEKLTEKHQDWECQGNQL